MMTAVRAGPHIDASPDDERVGDELIASDAQTWFDHRGWQPFAFQREVWAAMAAGRSGLLHATTGSGKTYAVWFGALARAAAIGIPLRSDRSKAQAPALGVLWLTPMRALAADTTRALQSPLIDLVSTWSIGMRTG